jgi:hypothetical protein
VRGTGYYNTDLLGRHGAHRDAVRRQVRRRRIGPRSFGLGGGGGGGCHADELQTPTVTEQMARNSTQPGRRRQLMYGVGGLGHVPDLITPACVVATLSVSDCHSVALAHSVTQQQQRKTHALRRAHRRAQRVVARARRRTSLSSDSEPPPTQSACVCVSARVILIA